MNGPAPPTIMPSRWLERRQAAQIACAYFGAVAFGVAQPFYDFAVGRAALGRVDAMLLVAMVHVVPTALLVAMRAAVGRFGRFGPVGRAGRVFDMVVYSAAILSVLRQFQLGYINATELTTAQRLGLVVLVPLVVVGAIYGLRRHMRLYVTALGLLSIVFPLHFVSQVSLPEPLTEHRVAPGEATRVGTPTATVVVLIFDELSLDILLDASRGVVDPVRFPNFHQFARDSVWFREAISNYPITHLSIPSLLTSAFAASAGTPHVNPLPEPNLLSALSRAGYTVSFYSMVLGCTDTGLRPGLRRHACGRYFARNRLETISWLVMAASANYLPGVLKFTFAAPIGVFPVRSEGQLLAELGTGEFARAGQASVFHLMLTHHPWVISADGRPVAVADYLHAALRDGVDIDRALRLYRGQVQYADRQFGAFLRGLKESGAWDRSVIVVTSDHGACWRPGCLSRWRTVSAVEPSLVRVPMMIRAPSLAPRIIDWDYQHIDFYPTMLTVLGIAPAGTRSVQGRSALTGAPVATRRRLFFANSVEQSVELGLPPRRVELAPAVTDRR